MMKIKYLLIVALVILCTGCGKRKEPRAPFGKVIALKGTIEVYDSQKKEWTVLDRFTEVFYGDSIRTIEKSEMEIQFEDDNILKLADSTVVHLEKSTDSAGKREIIVTAGKGKVLSELISMHDKGIRYVVQSPTTQAVAKGTHFLVYVTPVTFVTHVTVFHGHVWVHNPFFPVVEPVVIWPGCYTVVAYQVVPRVPIPMNYGHFKKMHRILGPRAYARYTKQFKIKPHKMRKSTFIVPHPHPRKKHLKGTGPFRSKAKLGPGKMKVKAGPGKIKVKAGPGKMKVKAGQGKMKVKAGPGKVKAKPGKGFKAKGKGGKGKGKKK